MAVLYTNMDGDGYGQVGHLIVPGEDLEFIWLPNGRQVLIEGGQARVVDSILGGLPSRVQGYLCGGDFPGEVREILGRDPAEIA